MGFYVRKCFSFGPLRLNLSRSGLGASVGVKGARIGVGPRGNYYVHAGRGGLYYRQNLTLPGSSPSSQPTPTLSDSPSLPDVESGPITEMHDTSSAALLKELNRAQSRWPLLPFAIGAFVLLIAGALSLDTDAYGWLAYLGIAAAIVAGAALVLYARHLDVTNGSVILTYDLDEGPQKWFSDLLTAFGDFRSCRRVWHIPAEGATSDWKRNAGANSLVKRHAVSPTTSFPRRVVCNVQVPTLQAGRQTLYFFPDRVLVYESTSVGSVSYPAIKASVTETMFREESAVPSDAKQLGTTWRYVNKNGGPDKRFNNNTQIPIMRYGVIHFTSPSGLNEMFHCSRPETVERLAAVLGLSGGIEESKPK